MMRKRLGGGDDFIHRRVSHSGLGLVAQYNTSLGSDQRRRKCL